ncbi:MAG TPA: hypothetical protein PLV92_20740, partial [Pirellulaceae bacterium]|nr:hypothetical protein [Pirellulaceae bacterium]
MRHDTTNSARSAGRTPAPTRACSLTPTAARLGTALLSTAMFYTVLRRTMLLVVSLLVTAAGCRSESPVGSGDGSESGASADSGTNGAHGANSASARGVARPSSRPRAKEKFPTPAERGYLGSAACVECHGEIAERYAQTHSMARSLTRT